MAPPLAAISLGPLAPELILLVGGCVALLIGQAARERVRSTVPAIALAALALATLILRFGIVEVTPGWVGGGLELGPLAAFVRLSALVVGILLAITSWSQPAAGERGEFFAMLLFSVCGLMLVGSAQDLALLFLALELVSIPTYVLVTLSRRHPHALEAGTKYFYLGAMSAAITAYGFSFLYGVAGTASLSGAVSAVTAALSAPGTEAYTLASIGLLLSLGGVLFKVAAVPFHFYIADVYQGAASPVAGLLGFVPKLAGFIAIFRLVGLTNWSTHSGGLFWLLWLVAAVSMTVGNVLALRQTNIKRMLGYSGVAHSGYMLVGVLAGPVGFTIVGDGAAAVLYYIVIYGIANLGAFAVLGLLHVRGRACETLRDVAGLLRRERGPALLLALAMFTLMGLPPTAGFWGKMSLFGSALYSSQHFVPEEIQPWVVALVVIAVLNSALAAAYYLRVIAACLLYESDEPAAAAPREALHVGAILCGFLLLIFSFYPNALLGMGRAATKSIGGLVRSIEQVEPEALARGERGVAVFPDEPLPSNSTDTNVDTVRADPGGGR
jgi:NADH-quinone oxidoreductase subunit N